MANTCRCNQTIWWHTTPDGTLPYDHDGRLHQCPGGRTRTHKPRPPRRPSTPTDTVEPTAGDQLYRRHVTDLARQLGVREQDLAYTIAYRTARHAE